MQIGIGLGLTQGRRARPDPLPQAMAFYASRSEPKVLLLASVASSRFQEIAGTTPATSPGQTVGLWQDIGGTGKHVGQSVAASCATYQSAGGVSFLQFDGGNDSLYSLANLDLTSLSKLTLVIGRRASTAAATSMLVEFGPNATSTSGTFSVASPSTGVVGRVGATARGSTGATITYDNATVPRSEVITVLIDLNAASRAVVLRINGVEVASGGAALGGNFISELLYLGRRANTSLPFNGGLTGVELLGGAVTSDELSLMERLMASRTFTSGVMP